MSILSKCRITIRVEEQAFDMARELEEVRAGGRAGSSGAMVSFLGLCRDEGGMLSALEIEHFPGMAQAEIGRIAALAVKRFPLLALTIVHRYGFIKAGEEIVLVIAASEHRTAAFEAVAFVMDYLKTDAPFWKKQHWNDASETKITAKSQQSLPQSPLQSDQQSDWVRVNPQDLERRLREGK